MIGLIQMNSAALKQALLPAPKRCLTEVQRLLPELAADKCAALLVVIKGANDKVCGIPSTVEEFVEFTAALAKITDEQVLLLLLLLLRARGLCFVCLCGRVRLVSCILFVLVLQCIRRAFNCWLS
jgi:hypothetical protein